MKTFLIEAVVDGNYLLPAHSHGYEITEAVRFDTWWNRDEVRYSYVLWDTAANTDFKSYLNRNVIPVGSIEFCLRWFNAMGVNPKPLNVPQELWKYCHRELYIDTLDNIPHNIPHGKYFCKSINEAKSPINQELIVINPQVNNPHLKQDTLKTLITDKHFYSEWVDIISEWRVFVLDKKIVGTQCYSGDSFVLPDIKKYEQLIKEYDKRCYTLDLMVYNNLIEYVTDIVEVHDFFACGLYGFDDYSTLLRMHKIATLEILKGK